MTQISWMRRDGDQRMLNRREILRPAALGLAASILTPRGGILAQEPSYHSPYQLKFRHDVPDLESGFDQPPWNSPRSESSTPASEWYSPRVRQKTGAWGPHARQYPAPAGLSRRSPEWMQDRVILAASRFIGYPYQHHHIPDWDPPPKWPWHKVAYGRNSRGVDCSNFSSFYYNYALGIKLDTGIRQQAERREVRGPGGHGVLSIRQIEQAPYDTLIQALEPADLLYIRNNSGKIAHVIMWLGIVGESPDHVPLVIDSTGGNHEDSNGVKIPIGVHIRPFGRETWYAKDFAHAHRIIPGIAGVRAGDAPAASEGGAVDL
jgi:cell wall-associated NlpC family hydrolase